MILDFTDTRDNDLRKAEKAVIEILGYYARLCTRKSILKLVCESPAPQFYVSYSEAQRVLSRMKRGGSICKKGEKCRMFQALYSTYKKIEKDNPGKGFGELVEMAINSPAPGFFLNEGYIYNLLNRRL